MKNVQVDDRLLGVGLYSVSDTSRIISYQLEARVNYTKLRRWAHGRKALVKEYAPIIEARLKIDDTYLFTFSQLIELFTVAKLREEGLSLRTIRYAHERAQEKFGDQPFARREYALAGKGIFEKKPSYQGDMEELATGRQAFEQILQPLLKDVITYSGNISIELNPLGKDKSVVLDPERSFGSPINRDTGTPTYVLYGMVANGEREERVAKWHKVSLQGVRDAVLYESALLKVA